MSLSVTGLPYISSGFLFAGLSNSVVPVALSSFSAVYPTPSALQEYKRISRIAEISVFAGATGLLIHSTGSHAVEHSFLRLKGRFTSFLADTQPVITTLPSGGTPSRTSGAYNAGRRDSSPRGASSGGPGGHGYRLRSHTRADASNGVPPGDDPDRRPPLPASDGGPDLPQRQRMSSHTAPHSPMAGSGPPPPPPPPASTLSGANDDTPFSPIFILAESALSILIFMIFCLTRRINDSPASAYRDLRLMESSIPRPVTQFIGDGTDLLFRSTIQHDRSACTTTVTNAASACVASRDSLTFLVKMLASVFLPFCHNDVVMFPAFVMLCLFSIKCYLSSFIGNLETAAIPLDQVTLDVIRIENKEHTSTQLTWISDASLEIGLADVAEFLVPKIDDIGPSLLAKLEWDAIDQKSLDEPASLYDNAFLQTTDYVKNDHLVTNTTFHREIPCSLDPPILSSGTHSPPLSPCSGAQYMASMSFFGSSTPRPNKLNLGLRSRTGSRSTSTFETPSVNSSIVSRNPTLATNADLDTVYGPRAHRASIRSPEIVNKDNIASLIGDAKSAEVLSAFPPPGSPTVIQAFKPRLGHRRRRPHRRRSRNTTNRIVGNTATIFVDNSTPS